MNTIKNITIISTCSEIWGGSEELWFRCIPYLQNSGYTITVCKSKIDKAHPKFAQLVKSGIILHELCNSVSVNLKHKTDSPETGLRLYLEKEKPVLVVVSQGINFDGLGLGYICLERGVPYVIISQKAVDSFWPSPPDRTNMRNVYLNAEKAYFVSRHNLILTEEQFGVRLKNADLVSNPIKIKRHVRTYPTEKNNYRLACLGRYFLLDKGQDILIRILSKEKWKRRPLQVSFIGSGTDKEGLIQLARMLEVRNVEFQSQVENVDELWKDYHGLILPSRFEGTPLVLLEAMAAGRMAIVSSAGGNPEMVLNNETGFVGNPSQEEFEEAMERAWQARDLWRQMGEKAFARASEAIPELPERDFAESLLHVINSREKNKLVTVIIPTYNRAKILGAAIESVLNQTYSNIQLIVADDGSTDDTANLLANYPGTTYLKLKHGGQAHARNEGLKHARGKYIASLDSDDTWHPEFVSKCLNMIEENNLDFVFTNWWQDMGNGQVADRFSFCKILADILNNTSSEQVILDNGQARSIYLTGCPSPSSSLLIKKSTLRSKWSSKLRIADDWCFLMDIVFTGPVKIGFTRQVLWHKKIDGQNIYDGRDNYQILTDLWTHDLTILFRRFRKHLSKEEKQKMSKFLAEKLILLSFQEILKNRKPLRALKYTYQALGTNASSIKQILGIFVNKAKNLNRN